MSFDAIPRGCSMAEEVTVPNTWDKASLRSPFCFLSTFYRGGGGNGTTIWKRIPTICQPTRLRTRKGDLGLIEKMPSKANELSTIEVKRLKRQDNVPWASLSEHNAILDLRSKSTFLSRRASACERTDRGRRGPWFLYRAVASDDRSKPNSVVEFKCGVRLSEPNYDISRSGHFGLGSPGCGRILPVIIAGRA